MKKIWKNVFAVLAAGTMATALVACAPEENETHTHSMTSVAAVEATCTEDGHTAYYKCDGCGKYYSDEAGTKEISLDSTVVEAKGHSMSAVEAKDATCTDKGNTAYYTCTVCGKYYSDEKGASEIDKEDTVIAAKGHTMTFVEAKDATETADGNIAYYTCDVCGKYFSDKDGKTEIDKEDTVVKYEGHVHSLSKVDAKEATCTEQGNIEYYFCEGCGKYFSDAEGKEEIELSSTVIPAAHDLTQTPAKEATCTEDGNTAYYTCSVCKKHFSDAEGKTEIELSSTVIPAAHDLTQTPAKEATCTEDGNTAYYICSVCKKYFSDAEGKTEIELSSTVIPAAHTLTETPAKEATCTEDGNTAYYTCSVCKKYFSDAEGKTEIELSSTVIPAAHTLTETPAKEATCTEDGNTAYYTCSVCKKYFSDAEGKEEIELSSTVIPAAHTLTETPAKEATCTEDGNTAYYTCSVCKKYFSDAEGKKEIDKEDTVIAAGHATIVVTVTQEPTATAEGKVEKKCSVCEEIVGTITLPVLTEANVENGTYDYMEVYRYAPSGRSVFYYRDGQYTYATTDASIAEPLVFSVQGTSRIIGSSAYSFNLDTSESATRTVTAAQASMAWSDVSQGNYIIGEEGWYKVTVGTENVNLTVTLINPDGTTKDLITSSDNLTAYFQTMSSEEYSMLVVHGSDSQASISLTVEKSAPPTVKIGEDLTGFSIAGAAYGSSGDASVLMIDPGLTEGTYRLAFSGTATLWRSQLTVTVNGVDYVLNAKPADDYRGYYVDAEFKPGDLVTVRNSGGGNDMSVTVILEEVPAE